jgi:hypothetical protein
MARLTRQETAPMSNRIPAHCGRTTSTNHHDGPAQLAPCVRPAGHTGACLPADAPASVCPLRHHTEAGVDLAETVAWWAAVAHPSRSTRLARTLTGLHRGEVIA